MVDCVGGASATLSSHLEYFTSNCFYRICLAAQLFPELQ